MQVFSALNQAEDELLLLWSAVEKDKDAVRQRQLELRTSRQIHALAVHNGASAPHSAAAAAASGAPSSSSIKHGVVQAAGTHLHAQHLNQQQQDVNGGLHSVGQLKQQQQQEAHEIEPGDSWSVQGQDSCREQQPQQQQEEYAKRACADARGRGAEETAAGQQAAAEASVELGIQEAAAAVALGGGGVVEGTADEYSRAASRRTTFTSIDGDVYEEEVRRSWLQPGLGRGGMGVLKEEQDPSQERLLPSAHLKRPRVQEQGSGGGIGGMGGAGGGVGKWEAAKASLGAWWVQQQQWLEGPGWGVESSTSGAAGGSSAAYAAAAAASDGIDIGGVTGRGSPTGEIEPGLEKTFWHTLWAMLRDMYAVVRGPERKAFAIAAVLAVFDQATASTAVINYAPEVLSAQLGITSERNAILYPAVIAVTKCIGVAIALALVDDLGRRPLLIGGGVGCGVALFGAAAAMGSGSVVGFLAALCLFIFSFSLSWAGLYWVVVSEVFSMTAKSPASSAATSLLFLTGSVVNLLFLTMVGGLGLWAFVVFGGIALGSSWYVFRAVPETKGKTLAEIQALLQGLGSGEGDHKQLGFQDVVSSGLEAWGKGILWLGKHVMGRSGGRGEGEADVELMGLVIAGRQGSKQGAHMGAATSASSLTANGGKTLHDYPQQQQLELWQQREDTGQQLVDGKVEGQETVGASTNKNSSSSRREAPSPHQLQFSAVRLAQEKEQQAIPTASDSGGDLQMGTLQGNVAYYQQQAWQRQQAAAAAAAATGLGFGGGGLTLPLGQELRPHQPLGGAGGHNPALR
jgi:hypothetical protein